MVRYLIYALCFMLLGCSDISSESNRKKKTKKSNKTEAGGTNSSR